MSNYIENKWFHIINDKPNAHICTKCCKFTIENSDLNKCHFNKCQYYCYDKVKNTLKYKTFDILEEILIVSLCHIQSFGQCPNQDKFDKLYKLVSNVDDQTGKLEYCLYDIFNNLVKNNKILLNPALGEEKYKIPSDCDIVIGNTLIDIKCTKKSHKIYEILQLLGYASLLKYNTKYNLNIEEISIINFIDGKCTSYNIKNITDDNLLVYLDLLSNKYNSNKKLMNRQIDISVKNSSIFDNICENINCDECGNYIDYDKYSENMKKDEGFSYKTKEEYKDELKYGKDCKDNKIMNSQSYKSSYYVEECPFCGVSSCNCGSIY